ATVLGSGGSHGLAHALYGMGRQSGVGAERGRGTRVGDSPRGGGGRNDPDSGPAGRGYYLPAPPLLVQSCRRCGGGGIRGVSARRPAWGGGGAELQRVRPA